MTDETESPLEDVTWQNQDANAIWQLIFNLLEEANADTEVMSFHQKQIRPEVLGQLLMHAAHRDQPQWPNFWLEVLQHIGPDSLQEISHAVGFMKKADEF